MINRGYPIVLYRELAETYTIRSQAFHYLRDYRWLFQRGLRVPNFGEVEGNAAGILKTPAPPSRSIFRINGCFNRGESSDLIACFYYDYAFLRCGSLSGRKRAGCWILGDLK